MSGGYSGRQTFRALDRMFPLRNGKHHGNAETVVAGRINFANPMVFFHSITEAM
jgi:hypothetical protein